jgi:hypothetical protein
VNARKAEPRAARSQIETVLGPDVRCWQWSIGASRHLDLLIVLEDVDA